MGLANYPLLGTALSYVYRSALVQMVIVIILLPHMAGVATSNDFC